jgi:hypothetical protein
MYLTQFEFRDKEYFSKWDNLLQFPADYLPSDPPRQRFRLTLMEELQQLIKDAEPDQAENIRRNQALRAIDWIIYDIQSRYKGVNYNYLELKRKLLS